MTVVRVTERVRGFANVTKLIRRKSGLYLPELDAFLPKKHNVILVHRDGLTGEQRLITTHNIITDEGDKYYAQKAAGEATTQTFNRFSFGTGKTAAWAKASTYTNLLGAIAGSIKAPASTYPKTNDGDSANTGAGVDIVTWLASYTSTDFTSGTPVTDGVITITSPTTGSPLLTGFTLGTSFTLASGDSVKVFVNHEQLGV